MEEIQKVRKCYCCGTTLQCDDPNKEGYTLPEILENPKQNFLFCQHCFETEKYHSVSNEPFIDEDFIQVINEAKEKKCLLVYVVNTFSFETSFSKEVIELIDGMTMLIIGTKFDLMPKTCTREDTAEYIAHRFRVAGLRQITSDDIIITSTHDEESVREALTRIFELKNAKSVYVVGSNDAGKTGLITSFLKIYQNLSQGNISTHNYKGTNLKVMEIPMTSKSSMYETPGISLTNSILFGLDQKTLRTVYLTKQVIPNRIAISKGQSLFIGGLGIIELLKGEKAEFYTYFHEKVQLHKSHVSDVETKFLKLIKTGALIPSISKLTTTKDMDVFDIEIKDVKDKYRDIGFSGLGWVSIKANHQKLRIYVPKGVSIYTSRPKVKNQK